MVRICVGMSDSVLTRSWECDWDLETVQEHEGTLHPVVVVIIGHSIFLYGADFQHQSAGAGRSRLKSSCVHSTAPSSTSKDIILFHLLDHISS